MSKKGAEQRHAAHGHAPQRKLVPNLLQRFVCGSFWFKGVQTDTIYAHYGTSVAMDSTPDEIISEQIAQRIRAERERLGLTQAQFAEMGGVGRATQLFYENHTRYPDTLYLGKLAKAGIDVAYLVSGIRSQSAFKDAEWLHLKPEVLWETLIAAHKVAHPDLSRDAIASVLASFKAYCVIYSGRNDDSVLREIRESTERLN